MRLVCRRELTNKRCRKLSNKLFDEGSQVHNRVNPIDVNLSRLGNEVIPI